MEVNKILDYFNKIGKSLFESPVKLSILLCSVILFFTFIIYRPAYNICDDFFMRTMAEGSANHFIGPSNFLLYINSYYGEILKRLYIFYPKIYWYDLLFYILLTISVSITSVCIFKKNNITFNIIAFLTMFFVYLPLFLSIQFTIVSGILAVAAVILAIYTINSKISTRNIIINCLIITFCTTMSCLIRFHAFFAVAIIGFIYFLFFVRKENLKKVFVIFFTALLAVALNTGLYMKWQYNIKKDPATKRCLDFNTAQVALFNNTISAENIFFPWTTPEKKIKNLKELLKKSNWTIGDYRLLLTWSYLGNDNIFSDENLDKAVKNLSPKIQLKKHIKLKFALDDYRHVKTSYFLIMLCLFLMYPSIKIFRAGSIFTLIFFVYIIALNIPFRTTPYRLWINFATLMPLIYLYYIKSKTEDFVLLNKFFKSEKFNIKYLPIILMALILLIYSIIGFRPAIKWEQTNKSIINVIYRIIKHNEPKLDKNKIYFVNIYQLEAAAKPFKKNLYADKKYISSSAGMHYPQTKDLLKHYNIPSKNTCDYICTTDNVEILTIIDGPYNDFYFDQLRLAVTKHMKDRYNKDVTFVLRQDYGKLKSYGCEVMTEDDLKLAKKLKKVQMYNTIHEMETYLNGNF